jgi:tetratricopeptide (TPR) repeat protein
MIVARIASELELAEQQRVKRKPPQSFDAWDNYLLGLSQFHQFSKEGHAAAQAYFKRAIELDPDFALAHALRAFSRVLSTVYFDVDPDDELLNQVLDGARFAVSLDEQDALIRAILGRVHLVRGEYDQALRENVLSVELNPCVPVTRCILADTLTCSGNLDEGLRQFELAIQLGPHDPWRWGMYSYRAMAHLFRNEYDMAAHWAEQATAFPNAHFWANANLAAALGHLHQPEQSRRAVDGLLKRKPEFSCEYAQRHLAHVRNEAQMDALITGLKLAGIP